MNTLFLTKSGFSSLMVNWSSILRQILSRSHSWHTEYLHASKALYINNKMLITSDVTELLNMNTCAVFLSKSGFRSHGHQFYVRYYHGPTADTLSIFMLLKHCILTTKCWSHLTSITHRCLSNKARDCFCFLTLFDKQWWVIDVRCDQHFVVNVQCFRSTKILCV